MPIRALAARHAGQQALEGNRHTALQLYFRPFLSYSQKALIAIYEFAVPFEPKALDAPDGPASLELARSWPMRRFPLPVDGDLVLPEASCIVEYIDACASGPLGPIPADPRAALKVRLTDRLFGNYVSTAQQKGVFDAFRPPDARDPLGVYQARDRLNTAFAWPDTKMALRPWAAG